jgi:hypothetical protein
MGQPPFTLIYLKVHFNVTSNAKAHQSINFKIRLQGQTLIEFDCRGLLFRTSMDTFSFSSKLSPHRQHFQNQKSHGNDGKKPFQHEQRASKYRGPSKLPTRDDPYDLSFNGRTTKPLATK